MSFTYSSSEESVATVDSTGFVTCVGEGFTTITVSQAAGNGYTAGSATADLQVEPIQTTIYLYNIPGPAYVNDTFQIEASSNSTMSFTYSSSNPSVATVATNGLVTCISVGSTTITVRQAAGNGYAAGLATATLTVIPLIEPTIQKGYVPDNIDANYGTFELDITSDSKGTITCYSLVPSVATVDGRTVTIVGPGDANIIVNQSADGAYNGGSEIIIITVNPITADWVRINTVPTGYSNAWSSVTYGSEKFVAVASAGTSKRIAICDNFNNNAFGNWELIESPANNESANNEWRSVTYGQNMFVAVASAGSKRVMTSPNGSVWSLKDFPDREWYSVTYGGNKFVVVGNNCIMTISADGTSYNMIDSPSDSDWRSVIYGNGLFVAVARSGSKRVMTSTNGSDWESVNSPVQEWYSVTYGQGKFIAVGNNCRMTSTDATDWTSTSFDNSNWRSITYTGNAFIAIGINCAKYSTNGTTWSLVSYKSNYNTYYNVNWSCVAYGAPRVGFARFIAVSSSGTVGGNIMSKSNSNSSSYSMRPSALFYWGSVTYGKDMFVATSFSSSISQTIMTSPNGTDWTFRTTPEINCISVCYGNNLFVAVSQGVSTVYQNGEYINTQVMTSSNGIDWTCQPLPDGDEGYYSWYSVCYGNSLFVAVASGVNNAVDGQRIMTSPDGIHWTLRDSPANNIWGGVCYSNNLFVAVAYDGLQRVMTSPDGINWSLRSSGDDTMSWNSICYGDKFVAVAESSSDDPTKKTIMTSTDGVHWTMRESADNSMSLNTVCYGNNTYLALAYNGSGQYAMTSPNGIDWVSKDCPMTAWGSVVYGNGRFVGVSYVGNAAIASLPITPTLSNFSFTPITINEDISKNGIQITDPTSNSKGSFSYTSSNPSVARIKKVVIGGGAGPGKDKGGGAAAAGAAAGAAAALPSLEVAEVIGGAAAGAAAGGAGAAAGGAGAAAGGAAEVIGGKASNVIFPIAPGETYITATQEANGDYGSASITAKLVISSSSLLAPGLSNFNLPDKTIGDPAFIITDPTSNSSGDFMYTSSNTNVATIVGRTVTIVGAGSTTITAIQAATANYLAGEISNLLTVDKAKPSLSALTIPPILNRNFNLTPPISNSDGQWAYTSSNTSVATISGSTVTIVGIGSTTITATQEETSTHLSGNTTATVQNTKKIPNLSNFTPITKTFDDFSFQIQQPTSNSNGSYTYISSETNVATISGNTVTIVGAGSTTITAIQGYTTDYLSGLITTTLKVNKKAPTISGFTVSSKTYQDPSFELTNPTPTPFSNGAWTFTSSNPNVATIVGRTVTIVGAGTTTITATQEESSNYTSGTATTTLTVKQKAPTISGFTVPSKTYQDLPFELTNPTSTSNGLWTYTSLKPEVATISENNVNIVAVGTTNITAKQEETINNLPGSITSQLVVGKKTPTLTNFSDLSKNYGDAQFTITAPNSDSIGTIRYSSSNTNVAIINENNIVINGVGETTITAIQKETSTHLAGQITAILKVNKLSPTFSNFPDLSKKLSIGIFQLTSPKSNSTGTITYTSSDPTIAAIYGSTVLIKKLGTTIITATQKETINYSQGTITATLTVN